MNESAVTIITDTREQLPLVFFRFPSVRLGLPSGDYSVLGWERQFAVERKSIADLVGTLTRGRERFIRELERLRSYAFRRWLIIGSRSDIEEHHYRSEANPKAILASVAALEIRYGIPAVWMPSPELAARQVEDWAAYFVREQRMEAVSSFGMTDKTVAEQLGKLPSCRTERPRIGADGKARPRFTSQTSADELRDSRSCVCVGHGIAQERPAIPPRPTAFPPRPVSPSAGNPPSGMLQPGHVQGHEPGVKI